MDLFDNVAEKSKEIGRAVVQAANEVVDKSKDMYNLAVARGDYRDACREYGEFIYSCERTGKKDLDKRSELMRKLDDAKARVDELNNADAQKKARAQARAEEQKANSCPSCGKPKAKGQKFCGECGAKYE